MALKGMSVVVEPTVSSETSVPSTSIRAVLPKRPPKEIEKYPPYCRIKILAVLNLDAGFKLGHVEKVSPIYRQIRDLARSKHTLDRGLDSIYLEHAA
jgi:hypothetical protein